MSVPVRIDDLTHYANGLTAFMEGMNGGSFEWQVWQSPDPTVLLDDAEASRTYPVLIYRAVVSHAGIMQ